MVQRPAEDELSKKRFAMVLKDSDGESDGASNEDAHQVVINPSQRRRKELESSEMQKSSKSRKQSKRQGNEDSDSDEMRRLQAELDRKNQFDSKREAKPTTVEGY